jgi:hypothetical protein
LETVTKSRVAARLQHGRRRASSATRTDSRRAAAYSLGSEKIVSSAMSGCLQSEPFRSSTHEQSPAIGEIDSTDVPYGNISRAVRFEAGEGSATTAQ